MSNIPRWIIDASDPTLSGLYVAQGGALVPSGTLFVRGGSITREIELRVNTPTQLQQPVDISGGTLTVTIGNPTAEATAGIFSLSYGADSTGLTGLSFDITAAALQTALNANPTLSSGSVSVTVQKDGNAFIICWNQFGVRTLLTANPTGLSPTVSCTPYRASTGAAAVREVQVLPLIRTKYASYNAWAVTGSTAGSISSVTAGSATANAVFDLMLSSTASGGTFALTYGRSQIYNLSVPANTAVKASGTIGCVNGSALNSTYFDLPGATGLVRFWYNVAAAGVAPSTPAGGSLQVITTVTAGDTDVLVAERTSVVIEAHADFTATASGATITWVSAAYGLKTTSVFAGTSGFTMGGAIAGNSGILNQAWIIIYDEVGSIGIWFDATSAGATGYPAQAAAADRQLRIVIAAGDSSTTVAGIMQTAVNADAKLTSTNTGNSVRTTVDAIGALSNPTFSIVSGLSAITSQTGFANTAQFNYSATASDFFALTGGKLKASQTSTGRWRLNAASVGTFATPTLNEGGLIQNIFFTGSISMAGANLQLAMDAAGSADIDAIMEVDFYDGFSVNLPCLRLPVKITRDIA